MAFSREQSEVLDQIVARVKASAPKGVLVERVGDKLMVRFETYDNTYTPHRSLGRQHIEPFSARVILECFTGQHPLQGILEKL